MKPRNTFATVYQRTPALSFLFGAVLGGIFFVLIFGGAVLCPTNVDWLLHTQDLEGSIDLTQHYLGWEFYRRSPWHFPLGLLDGLYSEPISVVYTDSIPLFAFIFKLLSPLLPEPFQYFGLFGLLCYVLMGGFAALLVHRFSGGRKTMDLTTTENSQVAIFAVFRDMLAAAFFISNPVMLNRMFLHTALAAHFLIVAGLCLWAYRGGMTPRKYVALWTVLIVCGTLINAYFTPILFGILLCSLLQELLAGRIRLRGVLKPIITPFIFTVLAAYLSGMFYGNVPAQSGGLEVLSWNLNGFYNPFTYLTNFGKYTQGYTDMLYSKFIPAKPLMTAYQNEGFSYFGLGALVLLAVAMIGGIAYMVSCALRRRGGESDIVTKRIFHSYTIAFAVYMIVFIFLALSPVATFGDRELYHIQYPATIYTLLSTFRSTARFIWAVYYLLLAGAVIAPLQICRMVRREPSRLYLCLLAAALLLQLVDLSPGYAEKHAAFSDLTEYESPLISARWDELGKTHENIVYYPPTYDGLYLDKETAMTFEIYALKYGLSLNVTYLSRDLTAQADERTLEEFEDRKTAPKYLDDTIYIFFDCVNRADLPDTEEYHLHYETIDGITIATDASHK